jgi:sterol desaturase/sphingolipid hydroxylase (fatty acid hydroxylase superfamily)
MEILQPLYQVGRLSVFTIFIGILLDTTICVNTTLQILKENPTLYLQGLMANYINLLFLSPIYYVIAYNYLLDTQQEYIHKMKYIYLLLIHSVGYYYIHQLMHKNLLFRWMHDFHHKFKITTPTSGNAVSIFEFQFAYVLPFLVGAIILRPGCPEFEWSIATISFFNLFIHSYEFVFIYLPPFLVTPFDHITHHITKSDTYAAPILNIDYIKKKIEDFYNKNF